MRNLVCAAALVLSLTGCASVRTPTDLSMDDLMGGGRAKGGDLQARIKTASAKPLGSRENPIRVNMPQGERAYLSRLRCADGVAPQFQRTGNYGPGVFGSIIDGYQVVCAGGAPKPDMLFMDMYHPEHDEAAAPPGYTLAGK